MKMQFSVITKTIIERILNMSKLHNPSHPGETLRDDVLPALSLSITEAADQLGVARPSMADVLIYGWQSKPLIICGKQEANLMQK